MRKGKKPKQLKIIPILVFISLSFLATLFYIFLSDIQIVPILLKNYINSGNSFFFPYIPHINIFWFLPEKHQIIHLHIGQVLDLIIIYNIISYIETNAYHYVKMAIINGDIQKYNCEELELSKRKEKRNLLFPNLKEFLDRENETRYIFENMDSDSTEKQINLINKRNPFNYQLKCLKSKILNNLYIKNSNFISNKPYNNFLFFLTRPSFKDSWMLHPIKNFFPLLKTNNFTYYNKIKQKK